MRYLVDTDWAIDHLHQVSRVIRRLEELARYGLGLSVISLAELYDGVFGSHNPFSPTTAGTSTGSRV